MGISLTENKSVEKDVIVPWSFVYMFGDAAKDTYEAYMRDLSKKRAETGGEWVLLLDGDKLSVAQRTEIRDIVQTIARAFADHVNDGYEPSVFRELLAEGLPTLGKNPELILAKRRADKQPVKSMTLWEFAKKFDTMIRTKHDANRNMPVTSDFINSLFELNEEAHRSLDDNARNDQSKAMMEKYGKMSAGDIRREIASNPPKIESLTREQMLERIAKEMEKFPIKKINYAPPSEDFCCGMTPANADSSKEGWDSCIGTVDRSGTGDNPTQFDQPWKSTAKEDFAHSLPKQKISDKIEEFRKRYDNALIREILERLEKLETRINKE